jgi:hypothetical protein
MSSAGDSGSPVIGECDNACLGHVVGGSDGYLTVVQAIGPQLTAASVTLRV